jgi:hypothetical protein
MFIQRVAVSLTTDAGGNNTSYSDNLTGRLTGVVVSIPNSGGIANTANFAITAEATAEPVVTLTNVATSAPYYPRVQVHDNVGAGKTYDGTRKVAEPVSLANDRVKIVLTGGGNTKSVIVMLIVE